MPPTKAMNQLIFLVAWSLGVAAAVLALAMIVRNAPYAVNLLRRIHLVAGVVALVAFILSGQYMRYVYAHNESVEAATRLMFRSAHIYLLYGALLNMAVGSYLRPSTASHIRRVQIIGSIGIIAVPVLLSVSLLAESHDIAHFRPIAVAAIYVSLASCLLHFAASLGGKVHDAA
jgi:hypothetical protein